MAGKRTTEIRVGIFMLISLAALIVTIVTLTSKTQIFADTYMIHTHFKDVAGLIPGSEVRLSGINVGMVDEIAFDKDFEPPVLTQAQEVQKDEAPMLVELPKKGVIYVRVSMSIGETGIRLITQDAKASIQTSGLLGKKFVEIVPGVGIEPVQNGDHIQSTEPISLTEALDKGGAILNSIQDTADSLAIFFGSLQGKEGTSSDLARAITHAKDILAEVKQGRGVLHSLIYDRDKSRMIAELVAAATNINKITQEITEGDGTMHDIIYGPNGKQLVANLRETSDTLAAVVREIKEGKGVIHTLIYEEDTSNFIAKLAVAADNLEQVTTAMRRGEGTIGALLMDPTIYEDIKKITGDVERSTILKAYIRYTIRKNEANETDTGGDPEVWGTEREG